jgi:aminopeptidase N
MVVLSNGRKISEIREPNSGLVAVRWLQDKPHVSYLITLVAGYLKKIEDQYRGIPLAFHTPASQIQYAPLSFAGTKKMMAFFEEEIGVPYPWDKYDQVCVYDFTAGGMENTSQTTLTLSTLHTEATENLQSSQGLVAHELAHQWFGDLVTCQDWAHLWINEGFATYYEALYDEHENGRDEFLYRLYQSGQMIARQPNDTNAIVRRDFKDPEEQFGYLAYPKGAWILHMLRHQLGTELYRRCIRTFVERYRFGTADTEDLIAVLEELSGRSFDQFFDQYVYHAHHPELAVQYQWDEGTKLAKISVQQKQKLSENVLLFQVPLTLRFKSKSGTLDRQILISRPAEDFYLALTEAPEVVRVDPDLALLAAIDFNPPTAMLYTQLADKEDALGRLLAAEKFGTNKERGAVPKLKESLNQDPFFGVRIEAAQALRAIASDEAFEALLSSTAQQDARVRQEVFRHIASIYREASYQALARHLQEENNPDIQAMVLRAIGAYPKPEVRGTLLAFLKTNSFRNSLAEAAIDGMRAQDDPVYVEPLLEYLQHHELDFFAAHDFDRALNALAFLAREREDKSSVRQFLLGHLDHKKNQVRLAAINALGTLRDTKALAALETFTRATKDSPERSAAEGAVSQLRESHPTAPELNRLRSEVLELQKENRQLRHEFDDLKKKLEPLEKSRPSETGSDTSSSKE